MSSPAVYHLGYQTKQTLQSCIANVEFYLQLRDIHEGPNTKHVTKYVEESQNWQLWADIADVLKGVTGSGDAVNLRKAIIVALAVIHGKSKTDLQLKLSGLGALGADQLAEEYKAVIAKAGKKAIDGLGIQATLRNFEVCPEAYATKAVDALKIVLQALPEINKRLGQVNSDSKATADYRTWFGDPAQTYAKVSANFAVMADAVEKRHVILSFDGTGCQDTATGGYVYKIKTTGKQLCNIHLCRKIFSGDRQIARIAATIMHELSHAAAQTADVDGLSSYGERSCKELAIKTPDKAANNADNYRWYAFPEVAD